jgi:monoamine oxidase
MSEEFDVLVVGAGAAGLAATRELDRAGLRVLCLEGRDRVGGRILTIRDPFSPIPIELGAEFIHGSPREIWDIVKSGRLAACECNDTIVYSENGKIRDGDEVSKWTSQVMNDMRTAARTQEDESFSSFLNRSSYSDEAKRWAISNVEGFNAAHKEIISIASLAQDTQAAEQIERGRPFRILNGYDSLAHHLLYGIESIGSKLRLNSVVERIQWQHGGALVHARSAVTQAYETFRSRRMIVTVPLGLLQAQPDDKGAIQFDPEPHEILDAARMLKFGHVIRLVLRFEQVFWKNTPEQPDAGFFFSQESVFPVWWTSLPIRAPIITGWSAGPKADKLLDQPKAAIVEAAVASLARIVGVQPSRLEAAYFHPWHDDSFSRGAYSYVPAGALSARKALAQPVADTLYFAGEATDLNGYGGTVHGAIASGERAARQVLQRSLCAKG